MDPVKWRLSKLWVIFTYLMVIFVLVTIHLPHTKSFPLVPVYLWSALVLSLNIIFSLFLTESSLNLQQIASIRPIIDVIMISFLLHFTGGVDSYYYVLYFLPLVFASIYHNIRDCLLVGILISVAHVGVFFFDLERGSFMTYLPKYLMRIPPFFLVALFTGHLSQLVDREKRHSQIIATVIKETVATSELQRILNSIISIIRKETDSDIVCLFEVKEGELKYQIVYGINKEILEKSTLWWSVANRVVKERAQVIIPDVTEDPKHRNLKKSDEKIISIISSPVIVDDKMEAILQIANFKPNAYTQDDADLLSLLALEIGMAIQRAWARQKILDQANLDVLTGLYSRRYFQEHLAIELNRAERSQRSLSLIMLDIDHFKEFNDTYGHPAGDELLRRIAEIMRRNLRPYDIPCRYGGEEFAIVIPETTKDGAKITATRIRDNVEAVGYRDKDGSFIKVTVSLGVASYPSDATTQAELISRADQALYMAKQRGRNRVCIA